MASNQPRHIENHFAFNNKDCLPVRNRERSLTALSQWKTAGTLSLEYLSPLKPPIYHEYVDRKKESTYRFPSDRLGAEAAPSVSNKSGQSMGRLSLVVSHRRND